MNGQVRVTFIKDDFNKIVELTNISIQNTLEDENKEAKKFLNKIMTYSFIKDEKVTMNLYPSEARFLINILNKNINEIEISNDWMEELKLKKEEYKKSKEGELNA